MSRGHYELPSMTSPPPSESWARPPPSEDGTLDLDNPPDAPPPSYDEATKPSIFHRFHTSNLLPRQLSRQLSSADVVSRRRDNQQNHHLEPLPEEEIPPWRRTDNQLNPHPGQPPREVPPWQNRDVLLDILNEDDTVCDAFWDELPFCVEFPLGCVGFVMPVAMIFVGALYYEPVPVFCNIESPYPLWLIVGGVVSFVTILFYVFCMSSKNGCNCCVFWSLLIFLAVWGGVGCYYIWGIWDEDGYLTWNEHERQEEIGRWRDDSLDPVERVEKIHWEKFKSSNCISLYYFVYSLIVGGIILLIYVILFLVRYARKNCAAT